MILQIGIRAGGRLPDSLEIRLGNQRNYCSFSSACLGSRYGTAPELSLHKCPPDQSSNSVPIYMHGDKEQFRKCRNYGTSAVTQSVCAQV